MSLKEYEYFLAIAEENNITKAALKMNVSQPSLTQQLQRTENDLGYKLLNRTNSGVQLTEAGESYLQLSRQILQLYENFKYEIGQLKNLEYGKLRVGASWYLSTTFVSKIVSEYAQLFPGIQINCIENRTSLLLDQLYSGQIDIAFVSRFPNESGLKQKSLSYIPLYQDALCVVAHTKYQLQSTSHQSQINLASLDKQPFIMFWPDQRIRQITDRIFSQADIHPQIRLVTHGFPLALAEVAAGVGIAVLPKRYIDTVKEQYDIQAYSIAPEYNAYWDIGAYYPNYNIMPFTLKRFVEIIMKGR